MLQVIITGVREGLGTRLLKLFAVPSLSLISARLFQMFFEGVEALMAAGTRADEVGFRLDYSRNELRKCIKEYPGKEVGKFVSSCAARIQPAALMLILKS